MKQYEIWYAIDSTCQINLNLNLDDLKKSHKFVQTIEADNPDDCYNKMQEDEWSPNGEADDTIHCLKLKHVSMSAGDVVIEVADKNMVWQCIGQAAWRRIYGNPEPLQACKEELADKEETVPEFEPSEDRQYPDCASINNLRHAVENTEHERQQAPC